MPCVRRRGHLQAEGPRCGDPTGGGRLTSNTRASIFEETRELDIIGFAPKPARDAAAPAAQAVRAIAEAANFPSREATAAAPADTAKRAPRRYRTGRNVQFNVRASPETIDAFYAVSDEHGWLLCQTLERAIDALKRELKTSPPS